MSYDVDPYGVIQNGPGTYRQAADDLLFGDAVVLDWSADGTLYNILFAFSPQRPGIPMGLVDRSGRKLWVGIAGRGCFGFRADGGLCTPEYAAEKLKLESPVDAANVAELITGVRSALWPTPVAERNTPEVEQ